MVIDGAGASDQRKVFIMSVRVDALLKRYGAQKAVDQISFEAARGEIVGLLGPNGAGKTTTMKVITGCIDEYDGLVEVLGEDVRSNRKELNRHIGYLAEHNPLYLDMYVREYLSYVASIYRVPNVRQRVAEVIEMTGLEREQHKIMQTLSKGYRQRVGLAQAFIHNPEVLILDEPTTGLDPNQLVEIRELIKGIGQNKTVIFSSHIMQEVQAICDRVIILHLGSVVADDKIDYFDQALNKYREFTVQVLWSRPVPWRLPGLREVKTEGDFRYRLIFEAGQKDPREMIFDFVVQHGGKIVELSGRKYSMEDVFQQVTIGGGKGLRMSTVESPGKKKKKR